MPYWQYLIFNIEILKHIVDFAQTRYDNYYSDKEINLRK